MDFLKEHMSRKGAVEERGEARSQRGSEEGWLKPVIGVVKVNYDASVDARKGCGIGFLERDDTGRVILAGSRRVQGADCVELVEAEAVLWAMQSLQESPTITIEVETDCKPLVTKLKDGSLNFSFVGDLVEESRRLASAFDFRGRNFARRESNLAAHYLASIRPEQSILSSAVEDFPLGFDLVLCKDQG